MPEVIIPVVAIIFTFTALTVIILAPLLLRSVDRNRLHNTLNKAFDSGKELPPEIVQALTAGVKPSPYRDLRIAVILLAIAGGFIVLGLCIDQIDGAGSHGALFPLIGVSSFPALIGLAFLGLWLAGRGKSLPAA
jgi:hypothetical protein